LSKSRRTHVRRVLDQLTRLPPGQRAHFFRNTARWNRMTQAERNRVRRRHRRRVRRQRRRE
jgi:hypothetical protein